MRTKTRKRLGLSKLDAYAEEHLSREAREEQERDARQELGRERCSTNS